MPVPVLVLGVGNVLSGDDALGVHAIRALAAEQAQPGAPTPPPQMELLEGGTGGLALLPAIADTQALIVIDAVDVGAQPGTVHVLTGADLFTTLVRLTAHQVGTADLLAAARLTGSLPEHVVLIGAQPATLTTGVTLSPAVAAALPEVLATVHDWCHRLGSLEKSAPCTKVV